MYNFTFTLPADNVEKFKSELDELCLVLNADFLKTNLIYNQENTNAYFSLPYSIMRALKRKIQAYVFEGYFADNQFAQDFDLIQPTTEYSDFLKQRYLEILTQSKPIYKRQEVVDRVVASINIKEISFKNLLNTLFLQSNKIVIGEDHGHSSPKQAVIDNADYLKEIGAVVVIENITSDIQYLIDQGVTNKEYSPIARYATPIINSSFLNCQDKLAIELQFKMLKTLYEKGIQIIAGDIETPNQMTNFSERQLVGNYCMSSNTENYLKNHPEFQDKPILFFTGRKHAESEKHVIGLAEKENAIALIIEDAKEFSIQAGKNKYYPTIVLKAIPEQNLFLSEKAADKTSSVAPVGKTDEKAFSINVNSYQALISSQRQEIEKFNMSKI